MSKSPAALHWPKKEKQTHARPPAADERASGINVKRERPSPTLSPPARRTLSVLLSKFL